MELIELLLLLLLLLLPPAALIFSLDFITKLLAPFISPITVAAASASSPRIRSHGNRAAAEEDFISQLPDDVLSSIVARLPVKEAVRTSALSNRWCAVYKLVPLVDFRCEYLFYPSDRHPHDSNTVVDGVDRFLRRHSGSSVRYLYLSCCLMRLDAAAYDWFVFSLGVLGIELLVMCCSCAQEFTDLPFSCHLLSQMPTLKYFHLGSCSLCQSHASGLCSLTRLPRLKATQSSSLQVLSLGYVDVRDGALECILTNCLSLHSLAMYCCKYHSPTLIFRGANLKLSRLYLACEGVEEIEFHASNLVSFEFRSNDEVNFVFDHVPKIEAIYLAFWYKDTMSCVCTKLMKELPQLKSLVFGMHSNIYQVSCKTVGLAMFRNITQLSIGLYSAYNVNLLSLAPFLQRCPLLEEFHLDTDNVEYYGQGKLRTEAVIHKKLKKVEITGHGGTENEIEFALYILRSAIVLEKMQISRCPKWYRGLGTWRGVDMPSWSESTLGMINKQLQGQGVSKIVRLTVEHSPIYENKWTAFDLGSFSYLLQ